MTPPHEHLCSISLQNTIHKILVTGDFFAVKRSQSTLYSEPVWQAGISPGPVCITRWTANVGFSATPRECRLEKEKADGRPCASVWWRAVEIPSGKNIHQAASALMFIFNFNLCLVLTFSCFFQDGDHFHSPGVPQGPVCALGALSSARTCLLPRRCPSGCRARVEGWVLEDLVGLSCAVYFHIFNSNLV